jgi:hypothetical protein
MVHHRAHCKPLALNGDRIYHDEQALSRGEEA